MIQGAVKEQADIAGNTFYNDEQLGDVYDRMSTAGQARALWTRALFFYTKAVDDQIEGVRRFEQ